ncbi:MAG: YihA family ribosome biogenesis GTP-binding protein [Eubacterium sp.]|nr:YihA family ribosome biogenesis GTP-binding protein [Eubacterium sp.]
MIRKVELETVCGITSELPQHEELEIAFWGRSNVGKSSLLNCIWGRKNLARTSSEPGKTQTINYYHVDVADDASLYMVDLPGYGYAKTSRETTAKWMTMIRRYLETSRALRVVFLLIDSRHDPTSKDIEQFRLLFSLGFNPLIVATKVDKLKKNEKNRHIQTIRKALTEEIRRMTDSPEEESPNDDELPVIPFSAATGEGRDEILEYIDYFFENL